MPLIWTNKFYSFYSISISKNIIAQKLVADVIKIEKQKQIVQDTQKRAHRKYKNNAQEISLEYYWPNITTTAFHSTTVKGIESTAR